MPKPWMIFLLSFLIYVNANICDGGAHLQKYLEDVEVNVQLVSDDTGAPPDIATFIHPCLYPGLHVNLAFGSCPDLNVTHARNLYATQFKTWLEFTTCASSSFSAAGHLHEGDLVVSLCDGISELCVHHVVFQVVVILDEHAMSDTSAGNVTYHVVRVSDLEGHTNSTSGGATVEMSLDESFSDAFLLLEGEDELPAPKTQVFVRHALADGSFECLGETVVWRSNDGYTNASSVLVQESVLPISDKPAVPPHEPSSSGSVSQVKFRMSTFCASCSTFWVRSVISECPVPRYSAEGYSQAPSENSMEKSREKFPEDELGRNMDTIVTRWTLLPRTPGGGTPNSTEPTPDDDASDAWFVVCESAWCRSLVGVACAAVLLAVWAGLFCYRRSRNTPAPLARGRESDDDIPVAPVLQPASDSKNRGKKPKLSYILPPPPLRAKGSKDSKKSKKRRSHRKKPLPSASVRSSHEVEEASGHPEEPPWHMRVGVRVLAAEASAFLSEHLLRRTRTRSDPTPPPIHEVSPATNSQSPQHLDRSDGDSYTQAPATGTLSHERHPGDSVNNSSVARDSYDSIVSGTSGLPLASFGTLWMSPLSPSSSEVVTSSPGSMESELDWDTCFV
eukprot:Rmarinus@m.29810